MNCLNPMKTKNLLVLFTALSLALLTGCLAKIPGIPLRQEPAADSTIKVVQTGTLALNVQWPQRSLKGWKVQAIPPSTKALVIRVLEGGAEIGKKTVVRDGDTSTVQAKLTIKAGNNYQVEVKAYRESAPTAQDTAIAQGSATVNVAPSQTTNASVVLDALFTPAISSLTVNAGKPGDWVTLTGTHFGPEAVPVEVYFGETKATNVFHTVDTMLSAEVPAGAKTGKVKVVADGVASVSNAVFWVTSGFSITGAASLRDTEGAEIQLTTNWVYKDGEKEETFGKAPVPFWMLHSGSVGTFDDKRYLACEPGTASVYVSFGPYFYDGSHSITVKATQYDVSTLATLDADVLSVVESPANTPWALVANAVRKIENGQATSTHALPTMTDDEYVSLLPDPDGHLFLVTRKSIQKLDASGSITPFVGASGSVGTIDGTGTAARFTQISGVARDASGSLFVADKDRIRKVSKNGSVETPHTGLAGLEGIAVDEQGNLYVSEPSQHRLWKINTDHFLMPLAGSGVAGHVDHNYPQSASFNLPSGLAVNAWGNLFVADTGNHLIRRVAPNWVVSTVVGTFDGIGGNVDGTGAAAKLQQPKCLWLNSQGNLLFATGKTVRKITLKTAQ